MLQLPIFGAVIEAAGTAIEKHILKNKKLSSGLYTTLSFLSIVVAMLPLVYFLWSAKSGAFTGIDLVLIITIVVFSTAANLCTYYALKGEKIIDFEPIWLMQPLFTILLASAVFGTGNIYVFALSLLASVALILGHIRKKHITFNRYAIALLLGNVFYAVELVASGPVLNYLSPFTLYFIRCSSVLVILLAIYRPKVKNGIGAKNGALIFIVGIMWVIYRMILYSGYQTYGIIFTTTMFILAPVFLLIMAKAFLREKMSLRQVISIIVILASVAGAVYIGG